jgi:hypothetical protein
MNSNDVFYVHCYLEGQVTPRFFMLDACLCSAQCTQLNTVTRLVFAVFLFIFHNKYLPFFLPGPGHIFYRFHFTVKITCTYN